MYRFIDCSEPVSYKNGLVLQEIAFEKVRNREYDGILLILEHKPVYTIGTGGGWENILCPAAELEQKGIDIEEINRGGNITFHGPGQLVAYPIFNLEMLKKDVQWYVDSLEEAVIKTLGEYGLSGSRKPKYRGVWVEDEKISALGIYLKRWVSMHGLSFNVNVDKTYFNLINPCGIKEFGVACLSDYIEDIEITEVKKKLIRNFECVFEIKLMPAEKSILKRDVKK